MQGFTLLEVLAAISLLGLLMVLATASFRTGSLTLQRSTEAAARIEQVRAAQYFLRQSIERLHPSPRFIGEAQRMEFVSALPLGLGGQPRQHRLELVAEGDERWSLRVAFFDTRSGQAWGQPQVLIDRLRDARLGYRGLDEMRRDSGWLDHWPWPQRLPRLVRIEAGGEGTVHWPTLSVALRSNQQTGAGL